MALIPLHLEHPVCAYCGTPLAVGDHCLILEDEEGQLFDAHAECHQDDLVKSGDEDSIDHAEAQRETLRAIERKATS
jgi:hypothetical protein